MHSIKKKCSLFKKNLKICFYAFFYLIRGCQIIRNKMSDYSEQDVRLSKRMSVYQYTPNLGSSASVLGPEREQGRFNQAREGAARRSKKSKKKQ